MWTLELNFYVVSLPQIIEWYEEYAEEFFQTHTELGESLEVALALEQEVKQFEESTQVSYMFDTATDTYVVMYVRRFVYITACSAAREIDLYET